MVRLQLKGCSVALKRFIETTVFPQRIAHVYLEGRKWCDVEGGSVPLQGKQEDEQTRTEGRRVTAPDDLAQESVHMIIGDRRQEMDWVADKYIY